MANGEEKQVAAPPRARRPAPPVVRWVCGYVLVLAAAVGLVYYWRAVFLLPAAFPAVGATLAVAGVFTLLYAAVFLLHRFAGRAHGGALKAAAALFCAGLLFCFATAPLQAPDEEKHFLRAQSVSLGRFSYDYAESYPDDVAWLVHCLGNPAAPLNHRVQYQASQMAPHWMEEYLLATQAGEDAPALAPPIMYMLVPFVPGGVAIALARLVGLGALGQLYAMRVANLLVYTLLCYAAFCNCRRYRGVFIALAGLPLGLFMAASCSYDGLMLALCYFAVSIFCRDEVENRHLVAFVAAVALANYIKPLNVLLVGVLLLIPKQRYRLRGGLRRHKLLLALGAALVAVLFWKGLETLDSQVLKTGWPSLPRGSGQAAAPGEQMLFVLLNPMRFVAVTLQSVLEADGFLFDLGRLGAMDMVLPLVGGLSVLVLGGSAVLAVRQDETTQKRVLGGLCITAVLYAAAVLGAMYIMDTDYASIRITGQQPRYFLPAVLLLLLAVCGALGRWLAPRGRLGQPGGALVAQDTILWATVAVAVVAAVLLFQNYFIGQWIPRGEGGWKLVNLYGWVQT